MPKNLCSSTQAGTTSCSQWWKNFVLPPRPEPHPAHNDERLSSKLEHILLTIMKYFCTYIHPGGNTSCSQWWKGSILTSIQAGTHPTHNDGRALHLHPSRWEHILLTMMEGLSTHIWSCRNQSYSHIRMAPSPPRMSYLETDQVPPFS